MTEPLHYRILVTDAVSSFSHELYIVGVPLHYFTTAKLEGFFRVEVNVLSDPRIVTKQHVGTGHTNNHKAWRKLVDKTFVEVERMNRKVLLELENAKAE